jgi:hypothetical protein
MENVLPHHDAGRESSQFSLNPQSESWPWMVLPNLFRIESFIGLAQPIPLKPLPKPRRRLRGVEKWSKVRRLAVVIPL